MNIYEHLNKTNNYRGLQMLVAADTDRETCLLRLQTLADALIELGDIRGMELLKVELERFKQEII